jgi:hemoglobin
MTPRLRRKLQNNKPVEEHEVYAAIGDQGFGRLIAAFYKQIPDDEILGPMYRERDLVGAEERLRGFLIYRFGGPQTYIENRGHPRLRMRHAPFVINQAARDRWMQLMRTALLETNLPSEPADVLLRFFESTASAMVNRIE